MGAFATGAGYCKSACVICLCWCSLSVCKNNHVGNCLFICYLWESVSVNVCVCECVCVCLWVCVGVLVFCQHMSQLKHNYIPP